VAAVQPADRPRVRVPGHAGTIPNQVATSVRPAGYQPQHAARRLAPLAVNANSGLPSGPRMIYNIKHDRPDIVVEPRTGSLGTSPVLSASTVVYRDSLPGRPRSPSSGRKHRCRDRPGGRASAQMARETELLPDHYDFKRVFVPRLTTVALSNSRVVESRTMVQPRCVSQLMGRPKRTHPMGQPRRTKHGQ